MIENAVLKAIYERKTARSYLDIPLTDEEVNALTLAAVSAPSAMNVQPWNVIAVKNKELILEMEREICAFYEQHGPATLAERNRGRGLKIFYDAPLVIFIPVNDAKYKFVDCGICVENIAIAAKGMGLDSVILGMPNVIFSDEYGDKWKNRLGFPEDSVFGIAIAIGHSEDKKPPHEPDLSKITVID